MPTLTDTEREMLDFSTLWWKHEGAREQAIRDRFGISATRFHQRMSKLIDREEAIAYAPALCYRLQRLRADRQRSRPTSGR